MKDNILYISNEQLDFIRFMASNISTSKLRERMDNCLSKLSERPNINNSPSIDLESIRNKHKPNITSRFLSLFGAPDGLKFLTHDFDPESGIRIDDIIKQSLEILYSKEYNYQLPKSLYGLINGFIKGPKWIDFEGKTHELSLSSESLRNWCAKYPTLHPITSPEFGYLIQSFRNTIRLSKPDFPIRVNALINGNKLMKNLRIKQINLDKVDFYTNVTYLIQYILKRVLLDIAKRDNYADVTISYDRSVWNEYRLHQIKIIHHESEANPFEIVKEKMLSQGGDMFELAKLCQGYCDWSIEANFEGELKRWRILNFRNLEETEELTSENIGFTHIFTFYKYK